MPGKRLATHTASYELLLIDNCSSDAQPPIWKNLGSRPGPARVVVIRNDINLGFAAGLQSGLAPSPRRYLVVAQQRHDCHARLAGGLDRLVAPQLAAWSASSGP